jgi:hypothetical protein
MEWLLSDVETAAYLGVNRYQDVVWFNKERYDILAFWLFASAVLEIAEERMPTPAKLLEVYAYYERWKAAGAASEYKVEVLLEELEKPRKR